MRTYVRMAHSNYLRQMARLLRVEQQLTVDQLALRLTLPRSTVYYWVRDLPLGSGPRPGVRSGAVGARDVGIAASPTDAAIALAKGGDAAVKRKGSHASSDAAYENALRSFDDLTAQPTFRDFVCLCITRGCTRERTKFSLTDSDPAVMRLANRWLLRLTDKSPLFSIQYESSQSLTELRRFWGRIVGTEARTIRVREEATRADAHEPGQRLHHGLLTVAVDDALLRARLQAWMRKTRDGWR